MEPTRHSHEQAPEPSGFARYLALDQPQGTRESFLRLYPSGLPMVYPMQFSDSSQAVPDVYLENNLPISFYMNKPGHAKAIFSTSDGHRSWRTPEEILPARHIHLWSKDEVQGVCNSIRKIWWAYMKAMPRPRSWDDLQIYFDAHDIYHYGALNLWNVIMTLFHENYLITLDYSKDALVEAGYWVDGWLESPENKRKLMRWQEGHGELLTIFTPDDWNSIGTIESFERAVLNNALAHRREVIGRQMVASRPKDLVSVYDDSLHNWLGRPSSNIAFANSLLTTVTQTLADEASFPPTGLPPAPQAVPVNAQPDGRFIGPSFRHENGRHYFNNKARGEGSGAAVRREPAVETLRKSVGVADTKSKLLRDNNDTGGIVIAHGTSALGVVELEAKRKTSARSAEAGKMPKTTEPDDVQSPPPAESDATTIHSGAGIHQPRAMDNLRCKSTSGMKSKAKSAAVTGTSCSEELLTQHASAPADTGAVLHESTPTNQQPRKSSSPTTSRKSPSSA